MRASQDNQQQGYHYQKQQFLQPNIDLSHSESQLRYLNNNQHIHENQENDNSNHNKGQSEDQQNHGSGHQQSQSQKMDEQEYDHYDVQDPDIYEVQKILAKRTKRGNVQYLIKWKDWDLPQHNSWEGMENLQNIKNMIAEFQNKQKDRKKQKVKTIKKKQKQVKKQKLTAKQRRQVNKIKKQTEHIQMGRSYNNGIDKQILKKVEQQDQQNISKNINKFAAQIIQTEQNQKNIKLKQYKSLIMISQDEQQPHLASTFFQSKPASAYDLVKQKSNKSLPINQQIKEKDKNKNSTFIDLDRLNSQQKPINLSYGHLNHYSIQLKKIYYEVDIVNDDNKVIGVKKVTSQQLKKQQPEKLRQFLERILIDIDQFENIRFRAKRQFKENSVPQNQNKEKEKFKYFY